jgi:hypothetical protein
MVAAVTAANPALAHTGITVEPARAGAKNAVANVNAEAESETAGVTKVQIFLPAGIAPDDITQVSLPKNWKLTKQDTSYTVEGPALAVGRNAEHKIKIRQLPMYESISFRVLQTYSDGRIDRWIALPSDDDPEPANPAPTVKLAGGSGVAPTATPAASPSPSPSVAASTAAPAEQASNPAPTTAAVAEPAADASDSSPLWWIAALVAAAAIAGGVLFAVRRRRTAP